MKSDTSDSNFGSGFSESAIDSVSAQFTERNICGEGASCHVYRIRIDGVRVAVKRLKQEHQSNPIYVSSYRKEYSIGRQLKHDAIPTYRELKVGFDEVYIVMDYVDGVSVGDFIKTQEGQEYFRSEENVRRFLQELLSVLAYLHRSGVVHCDLKPANVMLRHTDRGVMLLDLDKSYSDTLDLTHGGTAGFSESLDKGEHPVVQKDLSAVGTIIDALASRIDGFPLPPFEKFREACDSADTTADRLQKELESKPVFPEANARRKAWQWLVASFMVIVIFASILMLTRKEEAPTSVRPMENSRVDTVVTVIAPSSKNENTTSTALKTTSPNLKIDFDAGMSSFIKDVNAAHERLRTGNVPDPELTNLMYEMTEKYTSAYGKVVEGYKSMNPQVPGVEIELAVAKASESSKAAKLLQEFTKASADTMNYRHPD